MNKDIEGPYIVWENYGCEGWKPKSYKNLTEAFLKDMGERPTGKTIDRKNTNSDYEPNNCRWAAPKEQAANK